VREPYETLLGGYRDHWVLGEYLTADEPDWGLIANDPRLDSLSTGEKVLLDFSAAFANVVRHLDVEHQLRVMVAMGRVCGFDVR
jgi:hypothetical protein